MIQEEVNYMLYRAFRNQKALENMVNEIDSHPVVDIFLNHLLQDEFGMIYESVELDFIEIEFDEDKLCAKGMCTYWWQYKPGDIVDWGDCKLKYLNSLSLCEEIELQAHDGGLVYLYTGPRFIAFFERIEGELPDNFLE